VTGDARGEMGCRYSLGEGIVAIQSLTVPLDITWTRMAFARDIIDTKFGDFAFSPKWRSSLAVYYFIVPEEETADAYPNSRIVYLKFTASITGFNPSEELRDAKKAAEEAGTIDDLQRTLWEVILSSDWAETYWECLGAIMQIAVYPNNRDGVAPDDYPYFMDFEPKKRELFEQVTESGEFLSGSGDKVSTTKGSTNTQSVDYSAGGSIAGIRLGVSAGSESQQVDTTTRDAARERRETQSHSASFSQMYQLFTGYHLGTNRALFVIAPRPHTASSDFNLIRGRRVLEGVQDVFLVVHMPKSLDGLCVQAGLDTGHNPKISTPHHLVMLEPTREPDGGDEDGGGGGNPPPPPPHAPVEQLVVTRRVVQACGIFDENGNLQLRQVREPRPPIVVGEIGVLGLPTIAMLRAASARGGDDRGLRPQVVNNLNMVQSNVNRAMLDSASASNYEPRKFEETNVFKSLVASAATAIDAPLTELVARGYLSEETAQRLERNKIRTMGELYAQPPVGVDVQDVQSTRMGIVQELLSRTRRS
jgi:hypothetical protein